VSEAALPKLGEYFSIRKERGEVGLPTLSVTMNDGLVNRENLDRRTESGLGPEQHLRIVKGDIAYNMMRMWQGAFGRADYDGTVSPAYVILKPRKGIDTRFAAHWFKSARMIHLFWAYSRGLTADRLRLYADDFCQIPAAPPPLVKQRRIADILDAWDHGIVTIEALITAERRRKAEFVRRLLQDGRDRSGRLGDVADINPSSSRIAPEAFVSFVAMEDVSDDGRLLRHHVRQRVELGNGYTSFRENDVLVAKITPCFENGKGAHVTGLYGGVGFGSTEFHVVRPRDPNDARFIHHHVMASAFRKNGERYMTGSAGQRRVPAEFIEDYRIAVLSLFERERAARILDAADRDIDVLVAERERLFQQKRGLMQKLLTGEWRLNGDDVQANKLARAAS